MKLAFGCALIAVSAAVEVDPPSFEQRTTDYASYFECVRNVEKTTEDCYELYLSAGVRNDPIPEPAFDEIRVVQESDRPTGRVI